MTFDTVVTVSSTCFLKHYVKNFLFYFSIFFFYFFLFIFYIRCDHIFLYITVCILFRWPNIWPSLNMDFYLELYFHLLQKVDSSKKMTNFFCHVCSTECRDVEVKSVVLNNLMPEWLLLDYWSKKFNTLFLNDPNILARTLTKCYWMWYCSATVIPANLCCWLFGILRKKICKQILVDFVKEINSNFAFKSKRTF